MINVRAVDWTLGHLPDQVCGVPGHLTNMLSLDPETRDKAFEEFYAEAHDQGAVDPCTAASLPFLFAMADDPLTPDRAEIVTLLLSIGRAALGHAPEDVRFTANGVGSKAYVEISAAMPERVDAFVRYAADPDPLVRRPASRPSVSSPLTANVLFASWPTVCRPRTESWSGCWSSA
ncbi:hypothetical protein ACFQ67_34815 [Streptomyces sp. NPDC056488]|uniref:hypothetical protein n=1 Tax=Streptomyces sp. NPDC056488 TaxID=3345836 RepID=UPI0036B43A51